MKRERFELIMIFPLLALALSLCIVDVDAASSLQTPVKLQWHYYRVHNTCRDAEYYVRHQVELFYEKDKTIAPKLLRLLYSDCFVGVCINLSINHSLLFFSSFLFICIYHCLIS